MNLLSVRRFTRIALAFSLVTLPVLAQQPSRALALDPLAGIPSTYNDYDEFPSCNNITTTFCVETFTIDLDGDGVFETPLQNSGISFHAWLFSIKGWNTPGLSYEIRLNGNQELSPTIPAGTASQFSVNTGTFKPSPSLFARAEIIEFDVNQINGNWVTTGRWKTNSYTFGMESSSGGTINYNKDLRDYFSLAQGVQFYEEPSTLLESKKGMWVSTNASSTGEIQFDASTMTWSVELGGPSNKTDGSVNIVDYRIFIPDTFIQFAYGTTADVLAGALSMTRTDAGVTRSVKATVTRLVSPLPGILVTLPDIRVFGTVVAQSVSSNSVRASAARYSANPTIKISPKRALLRAPQLRQVTRSSKTSIRVVGSTVAGAKRYQAMCNKGLETRMVRGRTPNIRVTKLSKGKWTCKIRAQSTLAGRWSKTTRVTLR